MRRRRKIHSSAFRGRGRLRLSITAEAGHLSVHIHEARGLMGKSLRSCDSYVKLNSHLHHSVRMKTQTVPDNKNPEYNKIFTLCTRDLLLSRLLVSVFRERAGSRCGQLIGCMSFGVDSLVSPAQRLTGWFYLLGEEYGWSKHLRVPSEGCRKKMISTVEAGSRPATGSMEKPREAALGADLRKTPDPAPDTDLNRLTTASQQSDCSTSAGPKVSNQRSRAPNQPLSHDSASPSSGSTSQPDASDRHQEVRDHRGTQQLAVTIIRGKDGFGFTICSDCPVRVQAVDPGGPAHQSGLRQGDSVLQLNGLSVETWKCVDLAHTIRGCPSRIILVVWRGMPEISSGCEALHRPQTLSTTTHSKLLSHPTHGKHGRRWGQGSGVRSSLGALGSLWRDRKEEQDQEEEQVYSPPTTLKGTRVTSSNGDNYIILSPVNPGGQLLQPSYHDKNGTMGRLYQTHPTRGQNLLHNPRPRSTQQPFTSTLPPPPSKPSSLTPPNYGDYQNCTIVQSHLPHSGYGTYMTLAPKTLIFPIFVQPLDLCGNDRTLLLSEEVILHQADMLPAKVTVLIYSDLLLLTREDEAGGCHVLQSPLYLNAAQIREVPSEPLHIYFLQSSQGCWRCVFSLETFSTEQKVRVSLCLHDNIHLQLFATRTEHHQQLSDLPSDLHLLCLGQSDLLCRPSSPFSSLCDPARPAPSSRYSPLLSPTPPVPQFSSSCSPFRSVPSPPSSSSFSSTLRSPVWKERAAEEAEVERRRKRRQEEEVEERQQGEGESASETSESVGGAGGRGLLLSPHHLSEAEEEEESDEEEELFSHRPAALRRSFSDGSLLQEPRSPRFLSDSTIDTLTRTTTYDLGLGPGPALPSPQTLRKQLTREGASLQQLLLLLNGTKDQDSLHHRLNKKKSLAADVRSRLAFLRRRKNGTGIHGNSLEKALRNNRPSRAEVMRWGESLEALLTNQYGLAVFRHFLRSEFSEENLDFWLAAERFKKTPPYNKMVLRAMKIYDEFISTKAARQVNVDSSVRDLTGQSLHLGVTPTSFQLAQDQIFSLMETDSYPRFLKSRLYAQLANCNSEMGPASQSRSASDS
ncbi:regulator of G-protein signaling 3-like [Cololabis saira]|uniref:regulator of G-protein signaling 3-like n=1 Tax=Cololabis saira TaxID=129043 RepID=UPI002AD4C87B|nr:regulator of G-protein signaling 3-like [Cololabis saira]